MDGVAPEYDVVIMGTGLTECALSGVESLKGRKVLHLDRNDYYGGESASLNLEQMYKKFSPEEAKGEPWNKFIDSDTGKPARQSKWCIDLVPKLLMAQGDLVNILAACEMQNNMVFTGIAGSFVQQGSGQKATIAKVPSTAGEALKSPLMGIFEKRRARNFLQWVGNFEENNPSTHQGMNLMQTTMRQVYDKFGLEVTTREFIGHSMALFSNDEYLDKKGLAKEAIERIRLYVNSMARYGNSPYIYPQYGLGELPQNFARMSAVHGGTYMLNATVSEVLKDAEGKVSGIKASMEARDGEGFSFETKCKTLLADPTYFPERVKPVARLLRAICILDHPVDKTNNSDSFQLIIPQSQVGRRNDIYIVVLSSLQAVVPKGYYLATVSTIQETTNDPIMELAKGLERLGSIRAQFITEPIPVYEPTDDGTKDRIFISKSYDAESHFETTTNDIRDIWRRAHNEELKVEGLKEGQSLVEDTM